MLPWPDADGGVRVGSVVPTGFEAYARIFHPVELFEPFNGRQAGDRMRWSDFAAATGRVAHPTMEWHRIISPAPGSDRERFDHGEPAEGEMPEEDLRMLAGILREFTSTPELCWFCLWDGWGGISEPGPIVRLPQREYVLSQGPIEAVTSFDFDQHGWRPPNIWWPDDRAWCVASEIDLKATYVGGSRECVESLLGSGELEVMETSPQARVDLEADTINCD